MTIYGSSAHLAVFGGPDAADSLSKIMYFQAHHGGVLMFRNPALQVEVAFTSCAHVLSVTDRSVSACYMLSSGSAVMAGAVVVIFLDSECQGEEKETQFSLRRKLTANSGTVRLLCLVALTCRAMILLQRRVCELAQKTSGFSREQPGPVRV